MKSKAVSLISVLLLAAVFTGGCGPSSSPSSAVNEGINIGNQPIDFQLQTLDGNTVKLSDLRGQTVLLNFWATWCGPCRFEMPFLQEVHDTWQERGVVVLAVDVGESPDTVRKFMNSLNLTMPVLLDIDKQVARAYGLANIPSTFLVDKDGIIRQKVIGAFPNKEAIEAELSKIIPN